VEPSLQRIRGKRVREAKTTLPPPVLPLLQNVVYCARYDKTARCFLAGIHLAATAIWLN
jgi:hypothetical protein